MKKAKQPTVDDAISLYYKGHVKVRVKDPTRVKYALEWLSQSLGEVPIVSLRDHHTNAYAVQRNAGVIGQRAGDGTVRFELGVLSAALRYAVRQKLVRSEDVPEIVRPDAPAGKEVWLEEAQVDALLAFLAVEDADQRMSRLHRFVVLALATAARKGAVEQLTWKQVEWSTGLVRYDWQVVKQTKKRKVAVPMASWLVPHLRRMQAESLSDGDYVLDHPGNIRSTFEYGMRRASRYLGEPAFEELTPHALRHTAATLMLRAGSSLWQVAGILGDNPQTVAQTYGHHAAGHLRQAADSWKSE